jgi:hypothetical protein
MKNIEELWDEIYTLRSRLIHKNECPHCAGHVMAEEVNGIPGFYRCLECDWVWAYFGGLESRPDID